MEIVESTEIQLDIPVFDPADIDIPFTEFTLPNGLRLVVHEDHKAPIVAVNVWYHVGSKNEKPGKSGLAHLFEHLMFNGSEHFNDDYFQALMAIGATDLNGTTSHDRTNYFQNVPTAALDQVLWLESDRMGHLLGALDQGKLDEQRGVVQNEKRQRENVPYGREQDILTREFYPVGHPYSWTVIGSMEDLDGTTVEDCHNWFRAYYGAANAVLVIAGDVDTQDVIARVTKYFGDIPAGPAIERPQVNIPVQPHHSRMLYQDRVPESRIVMSWHTPQLGSREDALLDLAAGMLSGGKSSRFQKALVLDQRIATSVSASQWSREICGCFYIAANAKPGIETSRIEQALHEVLDQFIEEGPTEQELQRVRARYFSGFMKGMERIGGFGGKSDILASSTVYGGRPDAFHTYHAYLADATTDDIREVCRTWLTRPNFTLICEPVGDYRQSDQGVDRSSLPGLSAIVPGKFPEIERAMLDNGLEVVLARRTGTPTIVMEALFRAGFGEDQGMPGLATLTMGMLDEGTAGMDVLEISERLQLLGASLNSGAGLDFSQVSMRTLKQSFTQSLGLFAEVIRHPSFSGHELERLKKDQQVAIQREKVTPMSMALRVLPAMLFGTGHRYGQPLTGSGTEASVDLIGRDNIIEFYSKWLRPNNASLVVAGDISLDALRSELNTALGAWESADIPVPPEIVFSNPEHGKIYFLNKPGALQSVVLSGLLMDPFDPDTEIAMEMVNDMLGGQFISRINLNLREDKHWTYGARSFVMDTKMQRPWMVYSNVQMDKTLEAIIEIRKEISALLSTKPFTSAEFNKNKTNAIMALPGQWETNAAVAGAIGSVLCRRLPDDYYQHYPAKLANVTLEEVNAMAHQMLDPEAMIWFVVGDGDKVLPLLYQNGFAEVIVLDDKEV